MRWTMPPGSHDIHTDHLAVCFAAPAIAAELFEACFFTNLLADDAASITANFALSTLQRPPLLLRS
jgi:hypothetical protein